MHLQKLVYILTITGLFFSTSFGQNQPYINIEANNDIQAIDQAVYCFKDTTRSISIKQILTSTHQSYFTAYTSLMSHNHRLSTLWLKFTIQNQVNDYIWLIANNIKAKRATLFAHNTRKNTLTTQNLGDLKTDSLFIDRKTAYAIMLAQKGSAQIQTYYLKLEGLTTQKATFKVGTNKTISQEFILQDYIFAIFLGVVICAFIYNLFLYFSVREKIYLIYLIYLLLTIVIVPYLNGQPLFKEVWFQEHFVTWHGVIYIFITWFAVNYLNLRRNLPKLFFAIWGLTFLLTVIFPVVELITNTNEVAELFQLVVLVYYFTLLGSGFYAWFKGYQRARFYVLGWGFLIIHIFIFVLQQNNLISRNLYAHNSLYIGFILEILMFALALSDKFNDLKNEKEAVLAKNIALTKEQNVFLEAKVSEKTKELRKSFEEVQVMNEELQQSQEEIAAQRDTLEFNNRQLSRYQTRIGHSFRAAKMIQRTILNASNHFEEYFADHFLLYYPKDIVSGDFYWTNQMKGKTILVTADCTGHGVPGAFMTLIGKNALDKIVNIKQVTSPEQILEQLDQEIRLITQNESIHKNVGMDAAIITLDQKDGGFEIEFAGAKNGLWHYSQCNSKFFEFKGSRRSIGGAININLPFAKQTIIPEKGDFLYMGSDGLEDQSNKDRKKMGKKRIQECLLSNIKISLSQQKQALDTLLKEHMKGSEQRDDILWIGLKL